ncbi:hypothetical protein Tco_0920487 [Tanacetum coccineum]
MRREQASGAGDKDYFATTLLDYEAEFGIPFTLPHCWESSSVNGEALARLMVSELATHNERAMAMKKDERLAFLEIKTMEVECRERELAMHEYKQRQKDVRFYMQPYNHLTEDALKRMEEIRSGIKVKWNLPY